MSRDELTELVSASVTGDPADEDSEEKLTIAVIVLRTADRWYAVHAASVVEIVAHESVVQVPSLPSHVLGLALVHGRLIGVVDLHSLLEDAPPDPGGVATRRRLVIVREGDTEIAVPAAEARGVFDIPMPAATAHQLDLVSGEVKWMDELVAVLDAPALVSAAVDRVRRG